MCHGETEQAPFIQAMSEILWCFSFRVLGNDNVLYMSSYIANLIFTQSGMITGYSARNSP